MEKQEMKEIEQATSQIIGYSWLILVIVSTILLIINLIVYFKYDISPIWYSWPISYLFGAFTNLLAFNLIKRSIHFTKASDTVKNYLIRYFIYALAILYASLNDTLNAIIVFCGCLTVRLAIYLYTFSKNKQEKGG